MRTFIVGPRQFNPGVENNQSRFGVIVLETANKHSVSMGTRVFKGYFRPTDMI